MSTIYVKANVSVDDFIIEHLDGSEYTVKNGEECTLPKEWFLVKIFPKKSKTTIESIEINGIPLNELLYTGYIADNNKPLLTGTTTWKDDQSFCIWLLPTRAEFYAFCREIFEGGEYGTNLFDKFLLTVDRPVVISEEFSQELQDFYNTGYGVRWWRFNDPRIPYIVLDDPDFENTIRNNIDKIKTICSIQKDEHKTESIGYVPYVLTDTKLLSEDSDYDIDAEKISFLKPIFDKLKWSKVVNVHHHTLQAKGSLALHAGNRHDYMQKKNADKFYYTYENADAILFKVRGCGMIPTGVPILINTYDYSHAVINPSNKDRQTVYIYGY
jgi:hypothetical protein